MFLACISHILVFDGFASEPVDPDLSRMRETNKGVRAKKFKGTGDLLMIDEGDR